MLILGLDEADFVCFGCDVQFAEVPDDNWKCSHCEEEFCGGRGIGCQPAIILPSKAKLCDYCYADEEE